MDSGIEGPILRILITGKFLELCSYTPQGYNPHPGTDTGTCVTDSRCADTAATVWRGWWLIR